MSALRILKKEDGNLKKNDLYMISGTEYKEMTKEILAQSDLWAEIKKKADQKNKAEPGIADGGFLWCNNTSGDCCGDY